MENKKQGIIYKGKTYNYDDVGVELIVYKGRRYRDITPLFVDCGQATIRLRKRLEELASGKTK